MTKRTVKKQSIQEQSTAYHEAGHGVAAIAQGYVIDHVTIEPGEDSLGCCVDPSVWGYECAGLRDRKKIARDSIIISYAGLQAERLFNPNAEDWRSEGDEDNAFSVSREFGVLPRSCRCIGDDFHRKYLDRLRREAHRLVRQHWAAVSAVASALLRARTLSYDEVRKIIAGDRP